MQLNSSSDAVLFPLRLQPEFDQAADGFSQSVFRFITAFGSSILIGSPIILGSAFPD
jgi:hypothetical protein